ncbi:DUF2058 domain-containing protein [Parashewanella spongiae]|uniref:DUF2058 domain-containing protein n=1 Tax=Parashewanella spongiae TaxID=342950 RepID=A0A3A6TUY0_9GAMM|nr:DUF2058 domain-containing protein [Parashewanella spongiae]MCL1077726.1 DUF2058 domain-containing protein [Parashewanella spongiae]RJY18072.1 DUF2058 domain-containing protein [Parashewanella spongiae]
MANALQEQLLKAGLSSKQKVRDVKTQKRRNRKAKIDDGSTELKKQIADQKLKQTEKDRELNEQRFNEAMEKGQVRSLVTEFTRCALVIDAKAELKFNYTMNSKVFSLYITDEIQSQLLRGVLGIVRYEDKTYVVPFKLAERVNLLVPQWCGYLATEQQEEVSSEDDPYADYAIPDDLMW